MKASLWSAVLFASSVLSAPSLNQHKRDLSVSQDGTCGDGVTCQGSEWGDCCSGNGFCGSTSDYCDADCNSNFGVCGSSTATPSSTLTSANTTATTSALAQTTKNPTCPSSNGTVFVAASFNQYEVECGYDRPGNDLKSVNINSNTITGCIEQCEATTGCVDIIMSGTACYLKHKVGPRIKAANLRGARLFKRGPLSSTSASSSSSSATSSAPVANPTNPTCPASNGTEFVANSGAVYLIECYLDRTGNDIENVQVSSNRIADCINQCDSTPDCVDISMSGTACYKKRSTSGRINNSNYIRGARLVKPAPNNSSTSSATSSSSFTSTSVPLTTTPSTTGSSSGAISTSSSSAISTNSTISQNSTTVPSATSYAFPPGGLSSGITLPTYTSACSAKPTTSDYCVPCKGQGSGPFCGFTAEDDSYGATPITCNTVEVHLDLTECTVSPDGFARPALCVNGQTPGPLIEAQWGDTIVAHVTNSMTRNGTSIHWHGMRQLNSSEMDGVVSVTQCPIAPGQTQTYTFKASNYGFSWYHSHLTLQTYEGLFGPLLVHGPQTQTADNNAGQLIIQDWSHIPVDAMYHDAEVNGVRTMDTGLINGMNVWGDDGSSNQTGKRYTVPTEFVPGKSYMFNLVNTAIQSTYKFYIDGHKLTVISADYVPIVPYETDVLNINIGQRYQVIVTADQPVGDYWLRFDNQNACASTIRSDDIKGIIHYAGSAGSLPTSTAYNYTRKFTPTGAILGTCEDEPLASLVPKAKIDVGAKSFEVEHNVVVSNSNSLNLYRWYLDGTTFQSNWDDPTLYSIVNNGTVPDYSGNLAIELPNLGEWVYLIVESPVPLGHPIHLHGHDIHILASGYGTYSDSTPLNLVNPPRRDVAFLPGDGPTGQGGFLVLAFYTDNPGVWLAHCHIGWHVSMGFALQFIEAKDMIKDTVSDSCLLNDVCSTWRDWADEKGIRTDDSGV